MPYHQCYNYIRRGGPTGHYECGLVPECRNDIAGRRILFHKGGIGICKGRGDKSYS